MTDHHACFLSAIAAEPDNPEPKLIYADWLEEQGDPLAYWWRSGDPQRLICTAVFNGYGDGNGYGNGNGYGYGYGNGNGNGNGDGDGDGYGDSYGDGYGYGNGNGNGDGDGDGYGYGIIEVQNFKWEVLMRGLYVLVCDRGFVFVGAVRPHPSDSFRLIVDACHCVRRWGTSRGLGQLANEGPTNSSVLDYEGDGVDMLRAVIHRAIPCNVEAWANVKGFKDVISCSTTSTS